MKFVKAILPIILLAAIALPGCKKTKTEPGSVVINIKARYNGQAVNFDSTIYHSTDGKLLQFTNLKFYLTHLTLAGSSNHTLSDVELIDFLNPTSLTLKYNNISGDFSSLQFGCGVDSTQNKQTPNTVSSGPLSNNDMYWSMLGYRFEVFEGYWDNNLNNGFLSNSLYYHVGGNAYYRQSKVNQSFSFCCNNTSTYTLYIDLDKIFKGSTETIDIATENTTQSGPGDNPAIAPKFSDNFSNAFTF